MANKQGARLSSLLIKAGLTVLCVLGTVLAHANNVAVVVGCNGNGLRFADDDARLFAKTLVQFAGYKKEDVRVLTSKPQGEEREATAKNISQAIDEMAKRQADLPQSSFLFFASSHGVEVKGQGAMLAAKDYNPQRPLTDAQAQLTAQRLTQRLAELKSGHVIALFDICRKDGLLRSEKEKQNGFVLQQGTTGKVATLFSSSEGPSFECDDARKAANGHGYFTFYACRGLSARQIDRDKLPIVGGMDDQAGGVTVRSLHNYIRWNLLDQTKDLPGAGGMRQNREIGAGRNGAAEAAASGIGFQQLPELKCEAAAEQMLLARYAKGTCRAEISPEDRYAVLRDQGLDWYEKGKPERAAGYFEDAFGVNREAWAGFAAGVCYREAGKLKEAEEMYRNAIAVNPKYADAMNNLGLLLADQGKLKEAEVQYRNVVAANPKYTKAMFNFGLLLNKQGKLKEAEEQYRNAIAIDPKDENVVNNLGALFYDQGKLKEAEVQWKNAIKMNPKYATSMHNLGNSLYVQGNLQEAEEQWKNAIAADPKFEQAMYNLGVLFKDRGKFKEAEEQFRNAIVVNPKHAQTMSNLGALFYKQSKLKEAEEQYRRAIAADPKCADAMNNLGLFLKDQGKLREAEEQYRNAIAADPKFAEAMSNLGNLLASQFKLKEAEEQYRNAIAVDPKSSEVMFNFGMLLNKQGKLKEAEEQWRNAIAVNPKFADAISNLGYMYYGQGKLKEAEEQFRNAIVTDPKYANAMCNLGVLLASQFKLKEAEVQFRNAIAINPDDGLTHANLAMLLLVANRKDEALLEAKTAQHLGVKKHLAFEILGLKSQ